MGMRDKELDPLTPFEVEWVRSESRVTFLQSSRHAAYARVAAILARDISATVIEELSNIPATITIVESRGSSWPPATGKWPVQS